MKKPFAILLISVAVLVVSITAYWVCFHRESVQASFDGTSLDMLDGRTESNIKLSVNGRASYRFLKLSSFCGEITMNESKYTVDILLHNGMGRLEHCYFDGKALRYDYIGDIFTNDFRSIAILYYDNERKSADSRWHTFLAAPAASAQEAIELAKSLSIGTVYEGVNWGGEKAGA